MLVVILLVEEFLFAIVVWECLEWKFLLKSSCNKSRSRFSLWKPIPKNQNCHRKKAESQHKKNEGFQIDANWGDVVCKLCRWKLMACFLMFHHHTPTGTNEFLLRIQHVQGELRSKKDGVVTVGIGGPIGSGKSSLAEKVASVIGCTVISMEKYYRTGVDDDNDLDSIDFELLVQNLEGFHGLIHLHLWPMQLLPPLKSQSLQLLSHFTYLLILKIYLSHGPI